MRDILELFLNLSDFEPSCKLYSAKKSVSCTCAGMGVNSPEHRRVEFIILFY